ncbi:MAG: Crp/Fnr family transcriptional regulator [Bdellovibrio sp.]|jgi:CRP-like cAMP-binding protein
MTNAKENCRPQPQICDSCQSRQDNPLCSVEGAFETVKQARTTSNFKAGQTIFYTGNEPLGLYTVQSGLVKLEVLSNDGSAHTLRLMGPGQALGYRSLFAKESYQATAIAVEDSRLCFLPKNTLLSLVEKTPEVAVNLLRRLSDDLRTAEEKWVAQVDKDAGSRVAEAVLFLADHFKDQVWTRREISEWAGTTPETVMRTLAQFEKDQWIEAKGRHYKILDRERILKKAHGT